MFNTKRKSDSSLKQRHNRSREPPLPIYIFLDVHSRTRSKTFINDLHDFGLSISYDRGMELEEWVAQAVSERYEEDGVVCPTQFRKDLFTLSAVDNLDHNPTSNTANQHSTVRRSDLTECGQIATGQKEAAGDHSTTDGGGAISTGQLHCYTTSRWQLKQSRRYD